MFKKNQRISSVRFKTLFPAGKKFHTDTFFLVHKRVEPEEPPKFAVVVPKKVARRAVDRVMARRKIFGYLRSLDIQKPIECIVVVKKLPLEFDDLKKFFITY